MKRIDRVFITCVVVVCGVLTGHVCVAAENTLVRLSFWVPQTRTAEFEGVYREKVAPILKRHNLIASAERGRPGPEGVFGRLYEVRNPGEVIEKRTALEQDPAWSALMGELGKTFETGQANGQMRYRFDLYTTPSGPGTTVAEDTGKVVTAGPGTGLWRTFDMADELVGGNIRTIIQDRDGHIWFGATGGVSRFDGRTFTTFTTEDGLAGGVRSMLLDREGMLWFGTRNGVSRYDGKDFTNMTTEDGLAGDEVRSMLQGRDGHIWFGTDKGVSRYDGRTYTTFSTKDGLVDDRVWAMLQDRDGNIWFGTQRGVSRFDGEHFTALTKEDGLPSNSITSILQDRDGHIWFGTARGAGRYDGKTFTNFTTKDGLSNDRVLCIFQDRAGYIWFGTDDTRYGVNRYDPSADPDQAAWTTFTRADGPANTIVASIFQDREGYLWFGFVPGEVSRYSGEAWTNFTTTDGLAANRVQSIFHDRKGRLWVGTDNGVSRYDGKTWTTFGPPNGLANTPVFSIYQDRDDNLWFGSYDFTIRGRGVIRYDGARFTTFTTADGLTDNSVLRVFQDRHGDLWFGTLAGGASRFDGQTWTSYTAADGLPQSPVTDIFEDRQGKLYFATYGRGIFRFDGKTFTRFTREDDLGDGAVIEVCWDRQDRLWVATWSGGVSCYDPSAGADQDAWITLTTADGLAGNRVYRLIQDRKGHMWYNTIGGVSRYDGQTFQTLTHRNGLGTNIALGLHEDRDGAIWIGTLKGLTRFRPPPISPPSITIQAVVADRRYEYASELALPSTAGLMAFEFHGISMKTNPESMIYRYRLKDHDTDWQSTHVPRVEYQDLPRGTYTFEVQAVDRDLMYSRSPATVVLNVHLPYAQIGLVTALGIAIVLIGWQTARVIRRDRRLQEANAAMSEANKSLFELNRDLQEKTEDLEVSNQELQRDRAVERIRGEVQAMEQASDFEKVLSLLAKDLKTVGLHFDTCSIDVLDDPVDEPSMAYFEDRGLGYTSYTIDPEGTVNLESYHLSAPFPPLSRGPIERFTTGEVWQGRDMDLGAIAEVPITRYGRLRLTSADRQDFLGEEIETLSDFASAIALGYARHLDIREIQEQTERKSAFLASMSHELRTPMNAIKGFTSLVLRREKDLSERNRQNLEKVTQASDHLLAMINDLLDLSKIEAGRMDVNPGPFDVKALIASCCATVSPLMAERPNVRLEYEVDKSVGKANTDGGRVRQMVINLLSNAIKFTEEGEVKVKAGIQNTEYRIQKAGESEPGVVEMLEIAVTDTGKGIPEEELPTIFDEYRQVKGQAESEVQKGTGLGLSITRKFAELLGGDIRVVSEVGKGTTFTVRIPKSYGS